MNTPTSSLTHDTLDLWQVTLPDFFVHYEKYLSLLDENEQTRAAKFKFDIHRQRFVIARGILRNILQNYTETPAKEILLTSEPQKKPYLKNNPKKIEFNLSHSEDKMLCAITLDNPVGVDIEKMRTECDLRIADRFFSASENHLLSTLDNDQKMKMFFQLWTAKEAIVKMTGKGLWTALNSFSVDPKKPSQVVNIEETTCHVTCFSVDPEYASALATEKEIQKISYFSEIE
ncbi:MAG: 4'-phosphopantetheinyl transferase superfamily protein [Gammaproteobacteria bacterium]|nr:4'-phosphopantetheinyl transferase superfamily protein [Gammaproteobacteria bacterium]